MRLRVENLMAIKNADLVCDRVTVLVGDNGSGKSSLAKLLYMYLKSQFNYQKDFSNVFMFGFNRGQSDIVSRVLGVPYVEILERINEIGLKISNGDFVTAKNLLLNLEEQFEDRLPEYMKQHGGENFYLGEGVFFKMAKRSLDLYIEKKIDYELYHQYLYALFYDIFNGVVSTSIQKNKNQSRKENYSQFESGKNSIACNFTFSMAGQGVGTGISPLDFEGGCEVTYYNSPYVMDFSPLVLNATSKYEKYLNFFDSHIGDRKNSTSYIYKDICEKLRLQMELGVNYSIQGLGDINFGFDNQSSSFYEQHGEMKLSSSMSASGKKSLAQIMAILEYHRKIKKSLVILDEPETHLHPELQVTLAKTLAEEVKNNTNLKLVITSHSSFFVDAINASMMNVGVIDGVKYYTAERVKDGRFSFSEKRSGIETALESFLKAYEAITKIYDECDK